MAHESSTKDAAEQPRLEQRSNVPARRGDMVIPQRRRRRAIVRGNTILAPRWRIARAPCQGEENESEHNARSGSDEHRFENSSPGTRTRRDCCLVDRYGPEQYVGRINRCVAAVDGCRPLGVEGVGQQQHAAAFDWTSTTTRFPEYSADRGRGASVGGATAGAVADCDSTTTERVGSKSSRPSTSAAAFMSAIVIARNSTEARGIAWRFSRSATGTSPSPLSTTQESRNS